MLSLGVTRLAPDPAVLEDLTELLAISTSPKIPKNFTRQSQLVQTFSLSVGYPLAKRSEDLRDAVVSVLRGPGTQLLCWRSDWQAGEHVQSSQ